MKKFIDKYIDPYLRKATREKSYEIIENPYQKGAPPIINRHFVYNDEFDEDIDHK